MDNFYCERCAVQNYNTYPCKKSLEYIRTLNPQATEFVEQNLFI